MRAIADGIVDARREIGYQKPPPRGGTEQGHILRGTAV